MAASLALLAILACSAEPPARPRLVLLYATCTVNRSFLSPYDARVTYTPHLARLARDAVVFTRHQTEAGQSGIAYASLFSGVQADRHGVYTIPQRLSDDAHLVTEVFREAGWDVHAWLGHAMASPGLGYGQGVEPENVSAAMLTAEDPRLERVLQHLRANPDAKVFLLTNFSVTHGPYQGRELARFCQEHPDECGAATLPSFERLRSLYLENDLRLAFDFDATVRRLGLSTTDVAELASVLELLYQADVAHLDGLFGGVVDRIAQAGLLDESAIVFTADHGEVLYREDALFQWSHSLALAPEVLQVPLLIRAPGLPSGRYEAVTRSVDVLPTLASLAGIALAKRDLAGVDLAPALRGERPPPELLAFSHTGIVPGIVMRKMGGWEGLRRYHPRASADRIGVAVRRGDRILERSYRDGDEPAWRVYDWASGSGEIRDLHDPSSPDEQRMRERLEKYRSLLLKAHGRRAFPGRDPPEERQLDLLRRLGYVE